MNDPIPSQGVSESIPVARRGLKPGTALNLRPHDIITEGGAVGVLLSNRPAQVWVDQADFDSIVKNYGNRVWTWIELGRFVKLYTGPRSYVSVVGPSWSTRGPERRRSRRAVSPPPRTTRRSYRQPSRA